MTLDGLSETLGGAPGLVPIGVCVVLLVGDELVRERRARSRLVVRAVKWTLVAVALAICAVRFLAAAT